MKLLPKLISVFSIVFLAGALFAQNETLPVTVKKNSKGVWKASEFSSLLVGIKKPTTSNPADDL
ncbi:hypothetical protein CH371_02710 [Leptospira wolffii]|uniref:Uncharacterized protein n=1 Tax=Leptospira wolffii TaxID=409998 RepID=A0A2M9ZF07_9LEPT|nr:hypothetical protein [Leptospira wolffii]PJZ67009.1 hypothetical protein CH371_02710 [Leptospira wolffii]